MKELELYRGYIKHLPEGCLEAEVQAEKNEKQSVQFMDGTALGMSSSEQTELFVRASGERTGMIYTQKLDENPADVFARALENSALSKSSRPELMCTPEIWEKLGISMTDFQGQEVPVQTSITELRNFAASLELGLKEKAGASGSTMVEVEETILTLGIVNSKGTDASGAARRFEVSVRTSGGEGEDAWGYSGYVSAAQLSDVTAEYFCKQIEAEKKEKCPEINPIPGVYRAVLGPKTVNFLLLTGWQILSAKRIQNGASPVKKAIGEMVFSPYITIRDYKNGMKLKGEMPCGFAWEIDCEGVPSRDVTLVENGILKSFMHNLSTAEKDGVVSTGNAGRKTLLSGNIHTDMAIMPKNFVMESGEDTLEELLEKCGDGIYIFEAYDQYHSLDVTTGDFAFPCQGILVKDGKMQGLMKGLTMNGNICELFNCVEALGRDRLAYPLDMYQSYQVSGPAMLVGSLKVSG